MLDPIFLKTLVLLLAPFAPFMAEELWTQLLKQPYSVHHQSWPKFEAALAQESESRIAVQINGKLRGEIVKRFGQPTKDESQKIAELAKFDPQIAKYLLGHQIKRVVYVPGKLLNFVI